MKKLLIGLILFISLPSWGLDSSTNTLQLATGIRGVVGALGLSYEKMFTENHALQASVGFGFTGPVTSLGYRYFDQAVIKHKTGTFLNKCFFLFECDVHPYVGASLQYAPSTRVKIFSDENPASTYRANDRYVAAAVLGFRDVFKNNVILDLNFNYLTPLNRAVFTATEGPNNEDHQRAFAAGAKGLGLGLSLGYMF